MKFHRNSGEILGEMWKNSHGFLKFGEIEEI